MGQVLYKGSKHAVSKTGKTLPWWSLESGAEARYYIRGGFGFDLKHIMANCDSYYEENRL